MVDEAVPEREITRRASYLSRATELDRNQAEAIAYAEYGYSWSYIARKVDSHRSTVRGGIERAMAYYGLEIAETLLPEELEPPVSEPTYEPVGPAYLDELHPEDGRYWAKLVADNAERLPREWVDEVTEAIRERGVAPTDE